MRRESPTLISGRWSRPESFLFVIRVGALPWTGSAGGRILNAKELPLGGRDMVCDEGSGDNLDGFDSVLLRVALEAARLGTFDYDVVLRWCMDAVVAPADGVR